MGFIVKFETDGESFQENGVMRECGMALQGVVAQLYNEDRDGTGISAGDVFDARGEVIGTWNITNAAGAQS